MGGEGGTGMKAKLGQQLLPQGFPSFPPSQPPPSHRSFLSSSPLPASCSPCLLFFLTLLPFPSTHLNISLSTYYAGSAGLSPEGAPGMNQLPGVAHSQGRGIRQASKTPGRDG